MHGHVIIHNVTLYMLHQQTACLISLSYYTAHNFSTHTHLCLWPTHNMLKECRAEVKLAYASTLEIVGERGTRQALQCRG